MLVDPAGLTAAAARLSEALAVVSGDPVHPPLGADPASTGAAQRLSTAATALAGSLSAHLAALIATAEHLGLTSAGYVAADATNAATIAHLGGGGGGPQLTGSAPPAPSLAPDLRAPLPPPPAPSGQVISAAVHAGNPAAGEGFSTSWSQVATAAADAAETVRSVIGRLPDMLDTPNTAPAVAAHLTSYADTFDAASRRAGALARQADAHAGLRSQAGQQIPTPQEIADAHTRWQQTAMANIRSRGALAVQTAQAEADLRALETQAVTSYASYHSGTDAATVGDGAPGEDARDPAQPPGEGQPGAGEDPSAAAHPGAVPGAGTAGAGGPGTGVPGADPVAEATSPENMGQMASMLPQMIPTVLGAAGGLLGGLTKVPETLMQGGMQAVQGLTGMMSQKPDTPGLGDPALTGDPSLADPGLGDGAGGGGGGEVTPASGGPPMVPGSVTPSTGPPPTPPSIPAGGAPPPLAAPAGGMGGGMPMGMPMGGMAGGAGGAGAKGDEPRQKKVVTPPLPHTEAVTGKVNADRMAVSAIRPGERDNPSDDDPTGPQTPMVRRITMPPRDDEP
jgi:hypothetical protein